MSEFESPELPDWVRQEFDSQTSLPHGPLEFLPVPVEGQIIGAEACSPSDGRPARWKVNIRCRETVEDTMRFYEEFLPLSKYDIVAVGETHSRRLWFSRTTTGNGLIIFRIAQFVGRLTAEAIQKNQTRVEVEMAHCQHESVHNLVDREKLRKRDDVAWRLRP